MIPHKLLKLSSCDSTNLYIKEHLETLLKSSDDPHTLFAVLAKKQTKGKGQFQRKWESPEGNLYLSFVALIKKNHRHLHNFAQLLSLAVAIYLKKQNIPTEIKWPNDIYLENKKLGGCLIEVVNRREDMAVISGIGLNIGMEKEELEKIDQPAISLFTYQQQNSERNQETKNVEQIAIGILDIYCGLLETYLQEGFSSFSKLYASFLRKSSIKFQLEQKDFVGEFEGIYPDGRIQVLSGKISYILP